MKNKKIAKIYEDIEIFIDKKGHYYFKEEAVQKVQIHKPNIKKKTL